MAIVLVVRRVQLKGTTYSLRILSVYSHPLHILSSFLCHLVVATRVVPYVVFRFLGGRQRGTLSEIKHFVVQILRFR